MSATRATTPMLTVEEALERLLAGVEPLGVDRVALDDALGRVPSGEPIIAAHDVPPFANSSMDGYAVRAADGVAPRSIVGESRAGGPPAPPIAVGSAARIMTGAPLPDGADAVVPVERASESDGIVWLDEPPTEGAHVRGAGHDIAAGTAVRLPVAPITPAVVGLLAALGEPTVAVRRRPRVAILSTGDELAPAGIPLGPGQIHDANGPALGAAVVEAGGEPVPLEAAGDDPALIEERVREAAVRAELLVASGGVSVGEHDHVRAVIERVGSLDFWRIAVQPGKPLAFGHVGGRPVFGLPGNPVSALVTFELFVRPLIRAMLGLRGDGRQRLRARVDEVLAKDTARRAYLRVRVCREERAGAPLYRAVSAGGQASSQLLPLVEANALLVVPEGVAATQPGAEYDAIILGDIA